MPRPKIIRAELEIAMLREVKLQRERERYYAHRDLARQRYLNNREAILLRVRLRYEAKGDEIRAKNVVYGQKRIAELKYEALKHYSQNGKPQCVCCGVDDIDILCLDHINNNGREEIRKYGLYGSTKLYLRLKRNSYPEGYQTLCMNCNWKKEIVRRRGLRNGKTK